MLRKVAGVLAAAGMVVTVACGQTDAGITTNVKSKLAADDTVKAYQVDVDTQNYVVTLSGDVETSAAKERALMLARETEGVRDVIDQIRVTETAATSGIDDELRIDRDPPDLDPDAPDVEVDVDDNLESDARGGAEATRSGAERAVDATVEGAKKAGRATVEGAKKVGGAVRDAVTDDNPDSDRDGK